MIKWTCPECGKTVHIPGLKALELVRQRGKCQGCRAASTFRKKPELVSLILEFWAKTGAWPKSDCWMEALGPIQVS